jgi:hypothetical protein
MLLGKLLHLCFNLHCPCCKLLLLLGHCGLSQLLPAAPLWLNLGADGLLLWVMMVAVALADLLGEGG